MMISINDTQFYYLKYSSDYIVLCTAIATQQPQDWRQQQLGKHIPTATDMNATTEEQCFLCGLC
jgi:hypothetical protein